MCYVSHLKAVPGKCVLIIWDWTYHLDEEDSLNDNSDSVSDCSDGDVPSPQGCVRDIMQSGTKVQVKLRPEPENVHDQNVIYLFNAFTKTSGKL